MSALFVQADLRSMLRRMSGYQTVPMRKALLSDLIEEIKTSSRQTDLWMPAYNFEYFHTRKFNVFETRSEVGVLAEHFRLNFASWRTAMPVLSYAGTGAAPEMDLHTGVLYPNSETAPIGQLVVGGGSQLLLGCGVQWSSLFHYAEVFDGAFPVYRYEKGFAGTVIDLDEEEVPIEVRYAVTSLDRPVQYDFVKMHSSMMQSGAVKSNSHFPDSFNVDPQRFMLAWQNLSRSDPFWPLTEDSRRWVQPMVEHLGRGFCIEDFEVPPHEAP